MRLVAGTLAVFLTHSLALAEDVAPTPTSSPSSSGLDSEDASAGSVLARLPPSLRTKVPIRVVRILAETRQALLFDRTSGGTYLLVAVGEKVGDYLVEAIDEDEVTLAAGDKQVVLAAPDPSWRRGGERPEQAVAASSAPPMPSASPAGARGEPAPSNPGGAPVGLPVAGPALGEPRPIDPYKSAMDSIEVPTGAAGASPTDPVDPYADASEDAGAPRVARAPNWIEPGASNVRSTSAARPEPSELGDAVAVAPESAEPSAPAAVSPAPAAVAPAPASGAVTSPSQVTDAPAPATAAPSAPKAPSITTPAASALAPSTPAGEPVLTRREVDAALADFGALTVAFRASFTSAGVQVDSVLDGSMFAKAGLRAGDVIASIDGKPLRSLNDVAELYARASTLQSVTAQVVRGGKPTTLRVSIQ